MDDLPVAKKRGRKPKNKNTLEIDILDHETNILKLEKNSTTLKSETLRSIDNESVNSNVPTNKDVKKRGRKPKLKEEDTESKELKKRGRKPKPKDPEELLPKVPKKRGRKPKDKYGIVPKINSNYLENQINDNIILHLPIHSNDAFSDPFGEHHILKYNPCLATPVPYEKENLNGNNITHCPYPFDQTYNNEKVKYSDHEKSELNLVSFDNENNSINNETYDNESIQNNIDNNNNIQSNNKIISDNECLDKYMNENLNIKQPEIVCKTFTKNKLLSNMVVFKNNNYNKKLPENTNLCCWWCCHPFENYPFALPTKRIENTYYVTGCFCSPECCTSWNFNSDKKNNNALESYSLLNSLYPKIYKNKIIKIKCAPFRETLSIFGGQYSIEEFREINNNYYRSVSLLNPPMISIIPHIEEIYIDLIDRKDNYIPVDIERIRKVNNDLKLKRSIPVTNPNNTLENCMNLKYI